MRYVDDVRSVSVKLLRKFASFIDNGNSLPSEDEMPPSGVGPDALKYMSELANESFKRQVDIDESVWRSLPFLAATFAFVSAIVGRASSEVPVISGSAYPIIANILFCSAVLMVAWALRWFVPLLRKREYEYPSDDAAVRSYTDEMVAYHAALGLDGKELDCKVLEELRLFMTGQHGSAARTNFSHNAIRMAARSKVLLFMLIGFVLAFLCEATIFVHRNLYGPTEAEHGSEKGRNGLPERDQRSARASAPNSTEAPSGNGRSGLLGVEREASGEGEAIMAKGTPIRPTGNIQLPARPTPPTPQYLAKLRDGGRNHVANDARPPSLKKD